MIPVAWRQSDEVAMAGGDDSDYKKYFDEGSVEQIRAWDELVRDHGSTAEQSMPTQ